MIPRRILLTIITFLLLLSSLVYSQTDSTGTRNDTVAIEVLEERVKGNAEKTQIQIDGIKSDVKVRTDALQYRMDLYAGLAVLLIGLISWFGYKTVKGWARDRIEKMADTIFNEGLTDFKKRATEEVAGLIAEEAAKAEKQRRAIDRQAQELFEKVRAKTIERDKPADAAATGELSEYTTKLRETKTKDQYTAEDWFLLGYEADDRSDLKEAVKCYTSSIKLDPNEYWSHNNRGISFSKLERYDEAFKDYEEAIRLDPEKAEAYGNRGNVLDELGRYDEALIDLDKAIELDSKYTVAYNTRGATLDNLERFGEALIDYERAITLNPEYAQPLNNRGVTFIKLDRFDEALESYVKALEIDPEYVSALLGAVEVRILLGLYDDALQQASRAVTISKTIEDKATSLYLKCIAEKLLNKKTAGTEAEFEQILKADFVVSWSFDEIEKWLAKANISDDAREFIKAKTAILKAKKKKQ